MLLSRVHVALSDATRSVRQFAFPNVQEARYQFFGYIKIGKALTFGMAESTSRIGKSAPETEPILCP